MRVISLIASSTEMVCALGFRDNLVGRSHECDFPHSVQALPVCSEPRFNIEGTSKEIDDRVKEVVESALSVYKVFSDKLKELRPDVIITQDHCEVCAVSLKDVENAVCDIIDSKPKIVALRPNGIEDIWTGMHRISEALNQPEAGEQLITALKDRMHAVTEKTTKFEKQPTVGCIEWIDPLMSAGNWVPELVEMLGAKNELGEARKHSPWMKFADLKAKDPEIILIMPCGWDIKKCYEEIHVLTENPEWETLRAVQNKQIYLTDGNQYFNRPGPRIAESLEIMAEIFYPGEFNFGHHGTGWKTLEEMKEG